jgi:putative ABC transport system permease protein
VGIRKTFGAPKKTIVAMLSSEVIILIIISSLVAWPVAYFGIKAWLSGFSVKVSISPLIYLIASLTGLAIGWLSISFQAFRAADYNPAQALRYK